MNIGRGHVPQALDASKILATAGARIDLDRDGEFVIRLPRQTGRFVAWLQPAKREELASQHSQRKMAARYQLETKGDRSSLALRDGQVLTPSARAANVRRNEAVAEAFIRQIQGTTSPAFQARVVRDIRERVVELPPKVFANALAWQAVAASADAQVYAADLQALRSAMAQEVDDMPGAERLPATQRDQLIARAMQLFQADVTAPGAKALPSPEFYVGRASRALKLDAQELRQRAIASSGLGRSVRHSGITHTHIALEVQRFQAEAPSLKPDEFTEQLEVLREAIAAEAAESPARLSRARAALQSAFEALQPALDGIAARQPGTRKQPGETSADFAQRQRAEKSAHAEAVAEEVDRLTKLHGDGIDRVAADHAFYNVGSMRGLPPARLVQGALKLLIAEQARMGRALDDVDPATYLNAMLQTMASVKPDPRQSRM